MIFPDESSKMLARLSRPAVSTRWPFGENNTAEVTSSLWPVKETMPLPLRASHSRAVSSALAVRTRPPSAENTAVSTGPSCPLRVNSKRPDLASQMRAVLSALGHDRCHRARRRRTELLIVTAEDGQRLAERGSQTRAVRSLLAVTTRLPSTEGRRAPRPRNHAAWKGGCCSSNRRRGPGGLSRR